jgi:hypothetical protein
MASRQDGAGSSSESASAARKKSLHNLAGKAKMNERSQQFNRVVLFEMSCACAVTPTIFADPTDTSRFAAPNLPASADGANAGRQRDPIVRN